MADDGSNAPGGETFAGALPQADHGGIATRATFRAFRRDDVDAVRALLWRVWEAAYTPILGAKGVEQHCANLHTRGRLRELARRRDTHCNLVAEVDGRIIAFASAILSWNGAVDIYELYVDVPYQGMGIGTRLLAAAFSRFPGARSWRIEVLAQNTAAIALYERHGFSRTGSRPDWYQSDILVLRMSRPGDPAKRYTARQVLALHVRSLLQSFSSLA